MLTNIQRIRLYAAIVITCVIVIGVYFAYSTNRRLSDVRMLQDVKELVSAVELYKQSYSRYPSGFLDVRGDIVLTENGFAPGNTILYRGSIPSSKPVTYQSDQESYRINFTLRETWPDVGILTKDCQMVTYGHFGCRAPEQQN